MICIGRLEMLTAHPDACLARKVQKVTQQCFQLTGFSKFSFPEAKFGSPEAKFGSPEAKFGFPEAKFGLREAKF